MSDHLQKAVMFMLAPLVRLLLRHGVSHADFSGWSRQVYVNEAAGNFGMDGKPPTTSRIAIVTGINRKEVKRLRELPADIDTGVAKHNRAVRVVTGWLQDKEFLTSRGRPRILKYGDGNGSFNRLVKQHGGDVPARAMLDELERVGTISVDGNRVELLQHGYVPHQSEEALLDLFATSAADLLHTLDHNLAGQSPQRLQMSVAYDNVSQEGLTAFRQLSAERALALLRGLDAELSQHDHDVGNPSDTSSAERFRVGLGVYFIEDD